MAASPHLPHCTKVEVFFPVGSPWLTRSDRGTSALTIDCADCGSTIRKGKRKDRLVKIDPETGALRQYSHLRRHAGYRRRRRDARRLPSRAAPVAVLPADLVRTVSPAPSNSYSTPRHHGGSHRPCTCSRPPVPSRIDLCDRNGQPILPLVLHSRPSICSGPSCGAVAGIIVPCPIILHIFCKLHKLRKLHKLVLRRAPAAGMY